MAIFFSLCAFVSLLLKNISVIVEEGTTLHQHDLILTNYICNNPESESHSVMSNSLRSHGLYSPQNSWGQNAGMGSLSLLQGIFPTQAWNPGLLHYRWILTSWATNEASGKRVQFSSVQSLSRVWLFATPWTAVHQASLSITNTWGSPKPVSI